MVRRLIVTLALLLAATIVVAVYVTPWPSVLLTRLLFDHGARRAAAALESRVPPEVEVVTALSYDPADSSAWFDIYRGHPLVPSRPTVVWIHGGGFVSGRRSDIGSYLRILAGRGFTVVNLDYMIAPEARYPGPVRQVNRALAHLVAHHAQLGLPHGRFVLAGDSAGAQIAAQAATLITHPRYASMLGIAPGVEAERIAGVLLFCGVYDLADMGRGGGLSGWFVNSSAWAYSGTRDWRNDAYFRTMSLPPHLTNAFPPAFISAGNADPLEPQSRQLAHTLQQRAVAVTERFFAHDHVPPLAHEYQFDLDTAAGRESLDRAVAWLASL